jgi:hypothetical protein
VNHQDNRPYPFFAHAGPSCHRIETAQAAKDAEEEREEYARAAQAAGYLKIVS